MNQKVHLVLQDILKRPSLYFFLFVIVFSIDRHHRYEFSKDDSSGPFYSDVYEYYSFLPEVFYNYVRVPEQNIQNTRRTIGMAILYAPGFFVGDLLTQFTGGEKNGYTFFYQWSIRWGSIIYCIIGLFVLRKCLLFFFTEGIVLATICALLFGTNLFYYTYAWGEFPHSYLFFSFSVLIYVTLQFIDRQKKGLLPLIGFLIGFITLIRPTAIIVFLFPLLYRVNSFKDFQDRLKQFAARPVILTLSIFLFTFPLAVQGIIWKMYHGVFFYYSYGEERFFFNDPQIINFLFSFRKGWLLYTPVMILAVTGIIISFKNLKQISLFTSIYFFFNVYILSSWWEWSYGGSFGCRAMIESYAFLAFPFAATQKFLWDLGRDRIKNILIRASALLIIYGFIKLNLFQIWQYKYGLIHFSGMNADTYKFVFLRDNLSPAEVKYLRTHFTPPDPKRMIKGERNH